MKRGHKIRLRIGEDVTERLDVTPAKFRVIVTRRPKDAYRLADGEDRIVQAPAPNRRRRYPKRRRSWAIAFIRSRRSISSTRLP